MAVPGAIAPNWTELSTRAQIEELLRQGAISVVFHPVLRLESREQFGTEALARMDFDPTRGPQHWFAQAEEVGLLTELEILALRKALGLRSKIADEQYLFINASPSTLIAPDFERFVNAETGTRLMIDLSVAASVSSYPKLLDAIAKLREAGAGISLDDAADDKASRQRIEKLNPELIKLGPKMTRALPTDAAVRAATARMLAFADDLHADVIAEAIETDEEVAILVDLGVKFGQGFLFGRPAPL